MTVDEAFKAYEDARALRAQAEEQMQAALRALRANTSKATFVAAGAHYQVRERGNRLYLFTSSQLSKNRNTKPIFDIRQTNFEFP